MKLNPHKIILIIEYCLIVAPISLLFIIGFYWLLENAFIYRSLNNMVALFIGILTAASILAIWRIGYKSLNNKNTNLNNCPYLWVLIFAGALIVLGAVFSSLLPLSPPYSALSDLRGKIENFILGFPIIIVALHLYYETNKR